MKESTRCSSFSFFPIFWTKSKNKEAQLRSFSVAIVNIFRYVKMSQILLTHRMERATPRCPSSFFLFLSSSSFSSSPHFLFSRDLLPLRHLPPLPRPPHRSPVLSLSHLSFPFGSPFILFLFFVLSLSSSFS